PADVPHRYRQLSGAYRGDGEPGVQPLPEAGAAHRRQQGDRHTRCRRAARRSERDANNLATSVNTRESITMITTNPLGLLYAPRAAGLQIARHAPASVGRALLPPLLLALLPAAAWYIGTTRIGWRVGGEEAIRLTTESALPIVILFYLAMVVAVVGIGYMI